MNFSTSKIRSKVRAQVNDNTTIQQGISKYKALSKREQVLLCLLSVGLILYLFFIFVWQPIKTAEQDAKKHLQSSYITHQLLVDNADLIASTRLNEANRFQDRTAEELQTLVIAIMRQQKIVAQRLNLEGNSRLQVWVESTPYSLVAKLLAVLAERNVSIYNVQFISRSIGMVDMRLTLD